MREQYVSWIDEAGTDLVAVTAGGKGQGLNMLVRAGMRVPEAFVVTTDCYRAAITNALRRDITRRISAIAEMDPDDIERVDAEAERLRELIISATESHAGNAQIRQAYRALCDRVGQDGAAVAVRSSSADEDATDRSFAGEHDTYLSIVGEDEVCEHVRRCWASLYTSRAISYRAKHVPDLIAPEVAMAVVVQRMVDARAAGVLMTLNPANGDRSKIVIEASWGLGEPLVSGLATPDRFTVDKVTREVLDRAIVDKPTRATRDPETGKGLATLEVEEEHRLAPALSDIEITELVQLARALEKFAGCPQDAEFAVGMDGGADQIFLVQARPETVWSSRALPRVTDDPGADAVARVISVLTSSPAQS